jgi:hypothetical protein
MPIACIPGAAAYPADVTARRFQVAQDVLEPPLKMTKTWSPSFRGHGRANSGALPRRLSHGSRRDRARRRGRLVACGDAVTVLTALDAFYTEHRRCGDLDAGVEGEVVWIACDCGASMARRADEDDHLAD